MPTIDYNIRTTKDSVEVNLYKTGSTDILISAHTITNTFGVENIFSFSDEIFENGGYKIKLIDSLLNEVLFDGIDVRCFQLIVNATSNSPICIGGSILLSGSPSGMDSYSWSGPNGFTSNDQNPIINNVNISNLGLYTMDVTNEGLSSSDSVNVDIYDFINIEILGTLGYSTGSTISLSGSPSGLYSYNWTGPNNFTATTQNITLNSATIEMSGTYSLTGISNDGCISDDSVSVTVSSGWEIIVSGTSYTLPLVNGYTYNANIDWGDGVITPLTGYSDTRKTHTYGSGGTHKITISGQFQAFSTNNDTFNGSKLIEIVNKIPASLDMQYIVGAFYGCTNLVNYPNDLLYDLTNITDISDLFRYSKINTIHPNLFDMNTGITDMNAIFYGCRSITSIPNDLFRFNTNVTSFRGVFQLTKITTIPTNIFKYNINVTSMVSTFKHCYYLRNVPIDIFRYNTATTSFNQVFYNCQGITYPENLFYYNTNVTNYDEVFLLLDSGFAPPMDSRLPSTGSTLPCTLPTTMFNLSSISTKQPTFRSFMYNDLPSNSGGNNIGSVQDVWNYTTNMHIAAFTNQTTLTNYASIPSDWKS